RGAETAIAAALLANPSDRFLERGIEVARSIGLEPAEHRQRGRLDLKIAAAGAGDARLGGIEMAVFFLGGGYLLQKDNTFFKLVAVGQAVGGEGEEVRVLRVPGLRRQRGQLLCDVIVLTALGQSPDNVGVGDVVGSAAKR